jgi:alpha/beta superfamily hydrolase
VQGNKDDVVHEDAVSKLAAKLATQKGSKVTYNMVPGADHYFRNHMEDLNRIMDSYLDTRADDVANSRRMRPDRKRRQLPRG